MRAADRSGDWDAPKRFGHIPFLGSSGTGVRRGAGVQGAGVQGYRGTGCRVQVYRGTGYRGTGVQGCRGTGVQGAGVRVDRKSVV